MAILYADDMAFDKGTGTGGYVLESYEPGIGSRVNGARSGLVTGTTTDPLTYSTQGTFTVTWHYNDGNGNGAENGDGGASGGSDTTARQDAATETSPVIGILSALVCPASAET